MKHKIFELATIEDVPEILEIQHQAFAPQCKALGWNDCLPLNETLDSAYEDFGNFKTFKIYVSYVLNNYNSCRNTFY